MPSNPENPSHIPRITRSQTEISPSKFSAFLKTVYLLIAADLAKRQGLLPQATKKDKELPPKKNGV